MGRPTVILAAAAAAVVGVTLLAMGCGGSTTAAGTGQRPWEPAVDIVSPRNGARQSALAVVVKAKVRNFMLAPRRFGGEPQLGEGSLRFALNRVPDCVDPVKLRRALESPIGRGRLVGASFDFPRYSGPNGVLAKRVGSQGSYSPGTRPEIYYHDLRPGLYRLVITLAQNNGATTPFHAVTNFQILPRPGHRTPECSGGKVSSAKAASLN